jgi:putative transcriptional regulator
LTAVTEQIALLDIEEEPDIAQEDQENVCLYLGYSGWSQSQLRVELEEGAWWVFDSEPDDLISDPFDCWSRVLSRQNSPARLIAFHPNHSYLN